MPPPDSNSESASIILQISFEDKSYNYKIEKRLKRCPPNHLLRGLGCTLSTYSGETKIGLSTLGVFTGRCTCRARRCKRERLLYNVANVYSFYRRFLAFLEMLTSKTFVKKTKKGNVLKVVREHYLRDDIWCGSELCRKCKHEAPNLELCPQSSSTLFTSPHYIIPDTNVVLHQMDVLKDDAFKNVIVLQTVLQELRHRHAPGYNTIREILANKDRHFFVFTNEHHRYQMLGVVLHINHFQHCNSTDCGVFDLLAHALALRVRPVRPCAI